MANLEDLITPIEKVGIQNWYRELFYGKDGLINTANYTQTLLEHEAGNHLQGGPSQAWPGIFNPSEFKKYVADASGDALRVRTLIESPVKNVFPEGQFPNNRMFGDLNLATISPELAREAEKNGVAPAVNTLKNVYAALGRPYHPDTIAELAPEARRCIGR